MGKHGFLTPKAIANRIKAKGLQKLKWYCQMCQKQCRDENGFKCHLTSESHQRQLLLFAESPDKYIDAFSEEFLSGFIELLSRSYGTKRVEVNKVYQNYIHDREHVHMNSTQWETLTDFAKWLGKEGHTVTDESDGKWYLTYIDRDPETIRKLEAVAKKEKLEMDDDERAARQLQQQIERASASQTSIIVPEFTELQRENEDDTIGFSLGDLCRQKQDNVKDFKPSNAFKNLSDKKSNLVSNQSFKEPLHEKRKSALGEIMEYEQTQREKRNRRDNWLHPNIIVKVKTKKLGDSYYNKKAYVKEVIDDFGAIIKLLDTGEKMKIDQTYLETVIPALGRTVLIVNGAYRGELAILSSLNEGKYCCTVKIKSGLLAGRILNDIQYEDLSKLLQD